MISQKRIRKAPMAVMAASLLAMASTSVASADTINPVDPGASTANTANMSTTASPTGQTTQSVAASVYAPSQLNLPNNTFTFAPTDPPNPQHVAAAKNELSSFLSSAQSLISSDPVLAQTGAGAKVQQQQQDVSGMSDNSLEAFYNFTQVNSGWQDWLTREQKILQNVQQLVQKTGIQTGSTNNGSAANSNTPTAGQATASLNSAQVVRPSDTSLSSPNTTGTSVPSGNDTLTVTINPVLASGSSSQGAAQTISDPTVIDFSNVPSSPTPDQVWSDQLAADLMGMGANIAQASAGDAPSELMVVVLGEGTAVPDPARIVAEAIAIGLYSAQETLQETANHMNVNMANNNNLQASDQAALATNIYYNLLTALSNITTVNNNILTVNQNVQTVGSNVNVIDQHVQTLSYRDIERDLADGTPLVSLYLPVKNGGYLEDVQSFVQMLLKESASAGVDVSEAQNSLTEGNLDVIEGAFYAAYQDFVNAYHLLQTEAAQFNEKKDKDQDHEDKDHGSSNSK